MQGDAYGMFLVHYPIALWLQYWLFDFNVPATVKAPIRFVLTVAFSWALTRALRQIPAGMGDAVRSGIAPSRHSRTGNRTWLGPISHHVSFETIFASFGERP